MRAMLGFEEPRHRFTRDARQHPVERFDQGDGLAEFRQHCGRLQPDVAATDHDDARRVVQLCHHAVDVGAGAHGMDAGEVVAWAGQPAGRAAGRPDQRAIADAVAILACDRVTNRIDRRHALAQQHRHFALAPEAFGAQQQAIKRFVARQIILAERGAFVGQLRLVTDDRDRPRKAALA